MKDFLIQIVLNKEKLKENEDYQRQGKKKQKRRFIKLEDQIDDMENEKHNKMF